MLKIEIDNKLIDISDISFSIVKKSPIFFKDEGSFSLSFNLPNTPKNNKIFDFPSRISSYNHPTSKTFPCKISFSGTPIADDFIQIQQSSNNVFEAFLKLDNGNFYSDISGMFIDEIDYGDDIALGSTPQDVLDHALSIISQSYPSVNYQFPTIYNPDFFGEDKTFNPDFNDVLNSYDGVNDEFYNNSIQADPSKDNLQTLLPLLYLSFVLMKLFNHFGFQLEGDFFADSELATLLIYNNKSLDLKEKKYFLRASRTSIQNIVEADLIYFDDDSNAPNEDEDNKYNPVTGKYTISSRGYHNVVVTVKVNNFSDPAIVTGYLRKDSVNLDSITLPNGTEVVHSFTFYATDADIGKDISYLVKDEDEVISFDVATAEIILTSISISNLNIFSKTLNLNNHIPKILIPDFLNAITSAFCLAFFINNSSGKSYIKLIKNIINDNTIIDFSDNCMPDPQVLFTDYEGYKFDFSWSSKDALTTDNFKSYEAFLGEYDSFDDLPIPSELDQYAIVKNINSVYFYSADEDNNIAWRKVSDINNELIIDQGNDEVIPQLSPMLLTRDVPISVAKAIYPTIKQLGSSSFGTGNNDCDLHLLFYRGIKKDELNYNYPLASSSNLDANGNSTGNYSLAWDGDEGLYNVFWKDYIEFYRNAKKVIYYKLMTASDFFNLDFSRKYYIHGTIYLIKEIETTITNNEIKPAKITLMSF